MTIHYATNKLVTTDQFIELLQASTLAQRRPVNDRSRMDGMLANSNLIISAWQDDALIGIARCMTDFHYACYLSDLAVDGRLQRQGIGRELLRQVQSHLQPGCKIILIAAPAANDYYRQLGFTHNDRCWILTEAIG